MRIYVSTYCNKAHNLRTGKPVSHECVTIPPEVLQLEKDGKTEEAIYRWNVLRARKESK
jgi:hypothetical protein